MRIRVVAIDAAGNRTEATRALRVRRSSAGAVNGGH